MPKKPWTAAVLDHGFRFRHTVTPVGHVLVPGALPAAPATRRVVRRRGLPAEELQLASLYMSVG